MSKVALQGNASGTGTLTVAAPNTNSNYTLTLPNETGTVLTSASSIPASQVSGLAAGSCSFMVDLPSDQVISGTTWTLLNFSNLEFDTDSCYSTANKSFTAPAAGVYWFHARCNISGYTNQADTIYMRFYVNGGQPSGDATETVQSGYSVGGGNNWFNAQVSGCLTLSANDVVTARVYTNTGARNIRTSGSGFGGFRLS
jgi:hypothetical protein